MTNQVNQAFEEWIPPYWNKNKHIDDEGVLVYSDDLTQGAFIGYRAATQASESEINSLKQRVDELQADNERLREALEDLAEFSNNRERIDKLLSSTPAQPLAEHDNDVIERVALALENAEGEFKTLPEYVALVRKMKHE